MREPICSENNHYRLLFSIIFASEENVRIMTFAPYLAHTRPVFNFLELLPVENVRMNRVGIVMFFKFSCNILPDPIAKLYLKKYKLPYEKQKSLKSSCWEKIILSLTVQETGILFPLN